VRTTHHPNGKKQIHLDTPRSAQCLRHHVWMASCGDCRDARTHVHSPARDEREAA
jgi:hypothetical protein